MKDHGWIACCLLCLIWLAPMAEAGRALPDPILKQFEDGYGVVAAEVVSVAKRPRNANRMNVDGAYIVNFRVAKLIAETILSHPRLNLKADESFSLPLDVGYARPVEEFARFDANGSLPPGPVDPFPVGVRFYLTLRLTEGGAFEHARGADAALRVSKFDDHRNACYVRLASMAALPTDRRWNAVLAAAENPKEVHDVRSEALKYLGRYFVGNGVPEAQYRELARDRLWAMWRAADSAFIEDDLFQLLDYTACNFGGLEFIESPQRSRVWMDRIFKRPASGAAGEPVRPQHHGNLAYMLRRLAANDRAGVGGRIIAELRDGKWPAHFRNQVVAVFLTIYLETVDPEPGWEPELQDAVAHLATDLTDPQDFRILAMNLLHAATAEIKPANQIGIRQRFYLRKATRATLAKRITKLRARAKPDDSDQSAQAARELEGVLTAQQDEGGN